jgi:16S rRNA (guanine527-N7)-methyltransferase
VTETLLKYFPLLSDIQREKLALLKVMYDRWNSMINVISRKDMDQFFVHHVLHSLSIAKVINFLPGTTVLDVGTGGGFPGIPLAILFPDSEFTLLDSIAKKIKVVSAISTELGLNNVMPVCKRAEDEKARFNFVVSRAVTGFPKFVTLTTKNIISTKDKSPGNGIFSLKGGDLADELLQYRDRIKIWLIKDFFDEPFFETKVIVYLPV